MAYFSVSIIGIISVLFTGIGVLKSCPRSIVAQLFFAISLCFVAYIVSAMGFHAIDAAYRVDYQDFAYLVRIAPSAAPGLFLVLSHRVFQEPSKFPLFLALLIVVQFALSAFGQVNFVVLDEPMVIAGNSLFENVLFPISRYLVLLVTSIGLYWVIAGWRDDLVESRRVLRGLVLGIVSTMMFIVVLSENFLVTTDSSFFLSQQITVTSIAIFSVIAAITMMKEGFSIADLDRMESAGEAPISTEHHNPPDLKNFNTHFVEQKIYNTAGITVSQVARELKIPEYRLRSLILEQLGYRNFNTMLHEYRISDICSQLSDPELRNVPILTIALNHGYKSIASFNTAFRRIRGVTPSEFRKNALACTDTH